MTRRPPRRRRPRAASAGPRGTRRGFLAAGAALVGLGAARGSGAYTAASLGRGSALPVASDAAGVLGLDVAPSVAAGAESRLVTVTNRVGRPVAVTATLAEPVGTLSNDAGTLASGDSLVVAVEVSCDDAPAAVTFTVEATAADGFSAVATRRASVDAAGCAPPAARPSFAALEIVDTSTSRRGGRARYDVGYVVDDPDGSFDRVEVTFTNRGRSETETAASAAAVDTLSFEQPGQRFGDPYRITVRLFDASGEVESARVEVTDDADGGGVVFDSS
ncbi:hypothetical protein EXE48_02685 [Halorubrum sp. ASP1]|uniref:hypothetical protein n=1 Tax=Halorubrum sp. ASP1 TaxID=2518114 RepID=UPI0010F5F3AC|nr:hypothetical protein [Halorubrum sp. ASP1]TKX62698.1 hypothetical protein EXE48_02685 [Halorubrum sp. ASP1]